VAAGCRPLANYQNFAGMKVKTIQFTTKVSCPAGRAWAPRTTPDNYVTVDCDGCGKVTETGEYAFTVVLLGSLTCHFHDECFEYKRALFETM